MLIAIVAGILPGHFAPATGEAMKPLGDAFIKLIAPVSFPTIVTGNAVATLVVAKWEGGLDKAQFDAAMAGPSPRIDQVDASKIPPAEVRLTGL